MAFTTVRQQLYVLIHSWLVVTQVSGNVEHQYRYQRLSESSDLYVMLLQFLFRVKRIVDSIVFQSLMYQIRAGYSSKGACVASIGESCDEFF